MCLMKIAGPESGFSSVEHKDAFDVVRAHLLKLTIHSGEAAGWESIQDSIRFVQLCACVLWMQCGLSRHCGAHRIGHGVSLIENRELLKFVVDRRIPLECCPTSNLQTKAVLKVEDHPLPKFLKSNVVVTVNTDNPVVSSITLSGMLSTAV